MTAVGFEFPTSDIHDLLTTAVEGGIAYWAEGRNFVRDSELRVVSFEVRPKPELRTFDLWIPVNESSMSRALGLVLSRRVKVGAYIVGQIVTERGGADAECADVLVQVAAFGEILFG